jgi:carbon-monoxide dehydrogenase medium subunit
MIPSSFDYVVAESREHACELLVAGPARPLAGGQSLLRMMKLRLAAPAVLVDIGRVADLAGIHVDGDELVIGATTTHAALAGSPVARRDAPLLAHVVGEVGDPQVRHRGTIGGSVAQADPAADVLVALLALGGCVEVVSRGRSRRIPIDRFFTGYQESDLRPGELITAVRVSRIPGGRWAYQKLTRRTNEPSVVAVAVAGERVALAGMDRTPLRAKAVERALTAGLSVSAAAALAADDTDPADDLYADRDYRRHLARVLTRRALERTRQPDSEVH